jgi:hypothetical protein
MPRVTPRAVLLGLNGLANKHPDDRQQVAKVTWEAYKRAHGL